MVTMLMMSCVVIQVTPELFVDTTRGEKLRINMDVTLLHIPCSCKQLCLVMVCGICLV